MEMKSQVLEGGNLLNRIAIAREGHDRYRCRHGGYYHDLCPEHTNLHLQSSTIGSQGINQGLKLFRRGSQDQHRERESDQLPQPHLKVSRGVMTKASLVRDEAKLAGCRSRMFRCLESSLGVQNLPQAASATEPNTLRSAFVP